MQPVAQSRRIRFGAFEADLRAGELYKFGLKIKLHDQPFQVLALLLDHPGEVVTREELRQKLWPADTFVDFDVGLNSAVKRLRDALGDTAENPSFVETLPRKGYRFIGPVQVAPGLASVAPPSVATQEILQTPLPQPGKGRVHSVGFWMVTAAAALVALVLVAVGMNFAGLRQRIFRNLAPVHIQSIAVLPFDNMTGDASQEYLADGMTDTLTTELARVSALEVRARSSAMRFKGAKKPIKEIARELGVDALIEGSVRRSADRVWLTAQLIEAATERHVWAENYERSLGELPALQNEMARDIVRDLRVQLTRQDQARFAATRPVDPAAYEAYLLGRFYLEKRTPDAINQGIQYLDQATQKDPGFAPAFALLAEAYSLTGFSVAKTVPSAEAAEKARAAALKAIALDSTLAEAYAVLGRVKHVYDHDWTGAERDFQRAIQLNPNSAPAHLFYALFQNTMGRREEFCDLIQRAQRLDPLSPNILRNVAACLAFVRKQYDAAIAQARKAVDLGPANYNTHLTLAFIFFELERYPEALAEQLEADRISKGHPTTRSGLALIFTKTGKRVEAEKILLELKQIKGPYTPTSQIAFVCAALGRNAEAIRWLERAYEDRSLTGSWTTFQLTLFASLRADPRFQDFLRRRGLSLDAVRK